MSASSNGVRPLSTVELLADADYIDDGMESSAPPSTSRSTATPPPSASRSSLTPPPSGMLSTATPVVTFPRGEVVHRVPAPRMESFSARHSLDLDQITEERQEDDAINANPRALSPSPRTTRAQIHASPVHRTQRPSWLADGRPRTKQDERLFSRRRKTDPEGMQYVYHQDYQEALSSLLWEPYECRTPPATNVNDDADVSLWLYPPIDDDDDAYYNRHRPSSTASTASLTTWRVDKEASCSSLASTCYGQSGVFDLAATRYAGTPRGALRSQQHETGRGDCRVVFCCDQFEISRDRAKSLSTMLVNVETSTTSENQQDHRVSVVNNNGVVNSNCAAANSCVVNSNCVANSNCVVNSSGGINSNSNCYRAVPVVVSSVPSISCNNSISGDDNVSNVNVVQATSRTFTSTEAQTDDVGSPTVPPPNPHVAPNSVVNDQVGNNNRDQRRRERRERRQQRRVNTSHNQLNEPMWTTQLVDAVRLPSEGVGDRLPDILNSHMPPPYSTLPLGSSNLGVGPVLVQHPPPPHLLHPPPATTTTTTTTTTPCGLVPVQVVQTVQVSAAQVHAAQSHVGSSRFPFQAAPANRRRSRRTPRGQHYTADEEPKSCCGVVVTQTVSIRWFIVMIAFVGICCAVVGTVLGAMKASGREHLTVSLLMIGVGIVLITVSGVAWRLTAHDAPSCRVMLGLGRRGDEGVAEPNRRFVPRLPPSYGRPHHPYAAMMYPEFQYRAPPPSYQASMQEYRLRLLLLDRHGSAASQPAPGAGVTSLSPPPTYRSHPGTLRSGAGGREGGVGGELSRPPSYRSRGGPCLDLVAGQPHVEPGRAVSVISVLGGGTEPQEPDSVKVEPDHADLRPLTGHDKGGGGGGSGDGKDGNLVTIVSTGGGSSPVIVTVSGSTNSTTCGSGTHAPETEMDILAHL